MEPDAAHRDLSESGMIVTPEAQSSKIVPATVNSSRDGIAFRRLADTVLSIRDRFTENIHFYQHFVIDNVAGPVVLSARLNVTVLTKWSSGPPSTR